MVLDGVLREMYEELGAGVRARSLGVVHVQSFDAHVRYMIGINYLLAYEGGPIVPGARRSVDPAPRGGAVSPVAGGGCAAAKGAVRSGEDACTCRGVAFPITALIDKECFRMKRKGTPKLILGNATPVPAESSRFVGDWVALAPTRPLYDWHRLLAGLRGRAERARRPASRGSCAARSGGSPWMNWRPAAAAGISLGCGAG